MGDFNMPPGVSVRDIPGAGWDDPPFYPDIRCGACGCFIGYAGSKVPTSTEMHYIKLDCTGVKDIDHDPPCGILSEHSAHKFAEYDGFTSWYKCNHCGAESSVKEF